MTTRIQVQMIDPPIALIHARRASPRRFEMCWISQVIPIAKTIISSVNARPPQESPNHHDHQALLKYQMMTNDPSAQSTNSFRRASREVTNCQISPIVASSSIGEKT